MAPKASESQFERLKAIASMADTPTLAFAAYLDIKSNLMGSGEQQFSEEEVAELVKLREETFNSELCQEWLANRQKQRASAQSLSDALAAERIQESEEKLEGLKEDLIAEAQDPEAMRWLLELPQDERDAAMEQLREQYERFVENPQAFLKGQRAELVERKAELEAELAVSKAAVEESRQKLAEAADAKTAAAAEVARSKAALEEARRREPTSSDSKITDALAAAERVRGRTSKAVDDTHWEQWADMERRIRPIAKFLRSPRDKVVSGVAKGYLKADWHLSEGARELCQLLHVGLDPGGGVLQGLHRVAMDFMWASDEENFDTDFWRSHESLIGMVHKLAAVGDGRSASRSTSFSAISELGLDPEQVRIVQLVHYIQEKILEEAVSFPDARRTLEISDYFLLAILLRVPPALTSGTRKSPLSQGRLRKRAVKMDRMNRDLMKKLGI